jgi:hypothetical protein
MEGLPIYLYLIILGHPTYLSNYSSHYASLFIQEFNLAPEVLEDPFANITYSSSSCMENGFCKGLMDAFLAPISSNQTHVSVQTIINYDGNICTRMWDVCLT